MTDTQFAAICHSVVQTGVVLLLRSSLVLGLGLALARCLHRRGPLVQSFLYRATLLTVVLTGLCTVVPAFHVRSLWRVSLPSTPASTTVPSSFPSESFNTTPTSDSLPSSATPTPTATDTGDDTAPKAMAQLPSSVPVTEPLSNLERAYICGTVLWGAGTAILLSWLIFGQISLFLLRRQSFPLTTGTAAELLRTFCPIGPSPILLASARVHSPFLAGIRRPAIFLPTSFEDGFSLEEQKMVLAHEVAHWRHRDNAWMLLLRLTCAALWWQPLSWLLSRQVSLASEEACDIEALTMGCPARSYADCLLALAERLLPTRLERSLGSGVVPFRSSLGQRIQRLLLVPRQNPLPTWFRPATIMAVAVTMMLGFRMISGAEAPATANEAVREYIADCANGRLAQAYRLLSPTTQNYIAYTDFSRQQWATYAPGQRYSSHFAIYSLFTEPHNTANIRFEVIGNDPQQPNRVLVLAYQPGAKERTSTTISVATLTDPKTGSVQLDFVQTGLPLQPNIVQKLQALKMQRECISHLRDISHAILEYIQDHDEHFPHAEHWMDEITPYLKDTSVFHDPAAPVTQKYSYAFNRNLSGISIARVAAPAELVMVFDSSKGVKNASDTGRSLPHPGRHTVGNDYAYADGHVKWFGDISRYRPSFALQGNSSAFAPIDQQTVGRVGVTTIDNVPVHAGKDRLGRILCILPRGEQLAVTGKTDSDYTILMIDHTTGYISQNAVMFFKDFRVVADGNVINTTSQGYRLVQVAETYLGVPYRRGGSTRDGIGDAGLVRAVYAAISITLPRSAIGQAGIGYDVPHDVTVGDWTQWVRGDRLYFALRRPRIDHTGMYIGNGLFIHASVGHNSQVAIDRVDDAYYSDHLVAVRRSRKLLGESPGGGE